MAAAPTQLLIRTVNNSLLPMRVPVAPLPGPVFPRNHHHPLVALRQPLSFPLRRVSCDAREIVGLQGDQEPWRFNRRREPWRTA